LERQSRSCKRLEKLAPAYLSGAPQFGEFADEWLRASPSIQQDFQVLEQKTINIQRRIDNLGEALNLDLAEIKGREAFLKLLFNVNTAALAYCSAYFFFVLAHFLRFALKRSRRRVRLLQRKRERVVVSEKKTSPGRVSAPGTKTEPVTSLID